VWVRPKVQSAEAKQPATKENVAPSMNHGESDMAGFESVVLATGDP
jgi:hypothetical protein